MSISEAMNIKHQIRQSGFEGPAKRGQGPRWTQSKPDHCENLHCYFLAEQIKRPRVLLQLLHLPPASITAKSQTHDSPVSNDCNGKFFVFLSTSWTPVIANDVWHLCTGVLSIDRTETEEMCIYKLLDHTNKSWCLRGQLWDSHKSCLNMFRLNLNSFTNETLRRCCKGVKHYATLSLALGLVWELGCQFWYALRLDVARYNYNHS